MVLCRGIPWPGPAPLAANYPWGIHEAEQMRKVVVWEASTSGNLRSIIPRCAGTVANDGACASCSSLERNAALNDVIDRASKEDMHLTTMGNQYLTPSQQQARHQIHVQRESNYRLMVYKGDQRIARLLKKLDTHKRILLALSENKVPRVHALVLAELNHGNSPAAILFAIQEAVAGRRKATGNKDEVRTLLSPVAHCFSQPLLTFYCDQQLYAHLFQHSLKHSPPAS